MYQKIIKGQQLRAKLEKLSDKYSKFEQPTLTDLTLLQKIKEIIQTNELATDARLCSYFVPVVVILYSPRCFFGQSMRRGLRKAIAQTLNINTESSVSHTLMTVSGWLTYNKEFKQTIDALTQQVLLEVQP